MPDSVNTGGGSVIGGDANAGRDFVGRDQFNVIFNQAATYERGAWHMLGAINPNFVGRADEISRILALARQPGLRDGAVSITSLTGIGGIGKTELATVVAHALRDDFPNGELVFELKSHSLAPRSPAQELTRVLQLLYPQEKLPEDVASLRNVYANALRGKRCVVIIDDAKTDAEVDALRPPSGCVALITSRRQLARGQRVPIKKLNRAESVQVLGKYRALSAADADALAARCADHPLALNVAGAFLSHNEAVTAPMYLAALNENPVKAFSAGLDENDETQSLFAVFGYSFWSLSDEQQAAWLALSEMPASFDRAAGVAVSGVAENALTHPLNQLVDYNLLEFDPTTQRFAWHDLLKEYASNRLRPPEREAAHLRHARYFIQVGYGSNNLYLQGGDGVVRGLALFDQERAHLEAAFANLHTHKAHQELIELVDAVAYTSELRFHPRQRIAWLEAQREAARASGHTQAEGWALGNLGNAYADLGDARRAIEFYEQALVIDREIGDKQGEANTSWNLGDELAKQGDFARAAALMQVRVDFLRQLGHPDAANAAAVVAGIRAKM